MSYGKVPQRLIHYPKDGHFETHEIEAIQTFKDFKDLTDTTIRCLIFSRF